MIKSASEQVSTWPVEQMSIESVSKWASWQFGKSANEQMKNYTIGQGSKLASWQFGKSANEQVDIWANEQVSKWTIELVERWASEQMRRCINEQVGRWVNEHEQGLLITHLLNSIVKPKFVRQ